MGRSMFGPHRHERIALLGKFGDARLGRLKKGLGRSKNKFFVAKSVQNWERQKQVWTAQARADRCSCGVMRTSANQPGITSRRTGKPI